MESNLFDQGTDERIPVVTLLIDMFMTEQAGRQMVPVSDVMNLLLDIRSELNK